MKRLCSNCKHHLTSEDSPCLSCVMAIDADHGELSPSHWEAKECEFDQKAKAYAGKPKLTLVPTQIIYDIAQVREYGNNKYPDGGPDNWKRVEAQRYRDAAFRHFLKYIKDPESIDPESGIKHRKHLECNLAFLAEMEDGDE